MSDPVPIRSAVQPKFDAERELIDYCAIKVRDFAEEHGAPPTRVVLVLMGRTSERMQTFTTNYWDTEESRTESEMLGHAIALLTKRMSE